MTIGILLKYITAKRVRQTLKQSLSIIGAFYINNISYSLNTLINYKSIDIGTIKIIEFLITYGLILFLFYPALDFLLRFIFLKWMKKKILKNSRQIKENHKADSLRFMTSYKTIIADFVIDYPVGLGYISIKEFEPIGEIKVSNQEKDEAINEIIGSINKWMCTLIHLLVTLLLVFKYSPVLVYCLLGIGAILSVVVVLGIIILIENIELFGLVMKELNKRKLQIS